MKSQWQVTRKLMDGHNRGSWIRPVSGRSSAELSEVDRQIQNGGDPAVCDVILVPMRSVSQHPYQTENHLIDDGFYWSKVNELAFAELLPLIDNVVGPLWENLSSSTSGLNDRVDEARAAISVHAFGGSLCLIRAKDLVISVAVEGAAFNNAKRKVRGEFSHSGYNYRFAVTDPKIERAYLAQNDGSYDVGDSLLCIRLGDAYSGFAYKLIAAILVP
jgi:hypothetical protein